MKRLEVEEGYSMRLFRQRCDRCRNNSLWQILDLRGLTPRSVCTTHLQEYLIHLDHGGWSLIRKTSATPPSFAGKEKPPRRQAMG
jgi:hypothetical protein